MGQRSLVVDQLENENRRLGEVVADLLARDRCKTTQLSALRRAIETAAAEARLRAQAGIEAVLVAGLADANYTASKG